MVFKIFILFLTLTLGTLSNYFGQSKTNAASEKTLNDLVAKSILTKLVTKNGAI